MIIRIQKKLVLFLVLSLVVISLPFVIAKTGNYLRTRNTYGYPIPQEINNYNEPPGGTCGGSSGCGCGCGGPGTAKSKTKVDTKSTGDRIKDAENAGYKYYIDKYGDSDVEAVAKDYGCHLEVGILKDGQLVKRLGYSSGSVYE
ncbi:MAG: hypothetical protein ISS48_03255 [Candidatus Aenigmarchaeota archaeon]|nr:hypothetical protein [Candidatus Aenigmarchaeota archaeon]